MRCCVRQDAATEEQRVVVLALLAQYIRRLKLSLEEVTQEPHVFWKIGFQPRLQALR